MTKGTPSRRLAANAGRNRSCFRERGPYKAGVDLWEVSPLRRVRWENGWTGDHFANRIGCNPGYLSCVENGKVPMSVFVKTRLRQLFPDKADALILAQEMWRSENGRIKLLEKAARLKRTEREKKLRELGQQVLETRGEQQQQVKE